MLANTMPMGTKVPNWLRHFEEEPDEALEDLLVGRAELGHLSAAEPSELLLDWLDASNGQGDFTTRVDAALGRWIERSWGHPALAKAAKSASLTSVAWCRVAEVIAASKALIQAAACLRERVVAEPHMLEALHEGRARDPLGLSWLAISHYQNDRDLRDHWWALCNLPPDQPWYRGAYGLWGLRGLPPENPSQGGGFSDEVAGGLLRLGLALSERSLEGWLDEETARDEFLRTAHATMRAYPFPSKWVRFFRDVRIVDDKASSWVRKLFAGKLDGPSPRTHTGRPSAYAPVPHGAERAKEIGLRLAQGDLQAVDAANQLLNEQARYAEATGDTEFVVRSACNLANHILDLQPELALEWTLLGRRFDPWNGYTWTTEVKCLLKLHRSQDALEIAIETARRFPENVVARNGLAEVLKTAGKLEQAEATYRSTVERFPEDVVARTGLAEVLRAAGKLEQAEATYRSTVLRFPEDIVAHNGLQSVLRQQEKRSEERPSGEHRQVEGADAPTTTLLAPEDELLKPRDVSLLLANAYLLRRWNPGRSMAEARARARKLLERLVERDARAAGELGLEMIAAGELHDAQTLLRHAARLFPGSARVRYALARVERTLAEVEKRRLDAKDTVATVIQPWRRLARMDVRYQPVSKLGEARAWLALVDGSTVEQNAQEVFAELTRWARQHELEATQNSNEKSFVTWWAKEIETCLQGDRPIGNDQLVEIPYIRERLSTESAKLDTLEEEWIQRAAPT